MRFIIIFFIVVIVVVAFSSLDSYLSKLEPGEKFPSFKPVGSASLGSAALVPSNPESKIPEEPEESEETEETIEDSNGAAVSPFFEKLEISSITTSSYYERPLLITLRSRLKKDEKINITGWQIKLRKGSFIIAQGIEKYLPYYDSSAFKDIFISRGDTIYLINDTSPLGQNKNFRPNKCFGYLLNSFDFYPSISKKCPLPNRLEEISHLDEDCQEFILDIRRCEIPDYSNNPEIIFDLECRNYIDNHFNYMSCLEIHSKEDDFLEDYWYIYFSPDIISKLHDKIYLYDQNGLLVDEYIY